MTLLALVALCALPVRAQFFKDLTMSTNRTLVVVSPSTGPVSGTFTAWLVNSGQGPETIIAGATDSSSGTTKTISAPISYSVGPGQTATITITVRGTGGRFPYWIDFYAEIQDAPETRKTARLSVDTTADAVRPERGARLGRDAFSLATARTPAAFTLSGRAVAGTQPRALRALCSQELGRVLIVR